MTSFSMDNTNRRSVDGYSRRAIISKVFNIEKVNLSSRGAPSDSSFLTLKHVIDF